VNKETLSKLIAFLLIGPAIAYGLINFTTTVSLAMLIILYIYICFKKPLFGLAIIIFLPILGELSRIDLFGRSMILSDLIVPIFVLVFLSKHLKTNFIKKLKQPLLGLFIFITIAVISLIISLASIPLKEVINSSQYLIRFFFYTPLFPISYIIAQKEHHKIYKYLIYSALLICLTGLIQLLIFPSLESLESAGYDPHINRLVGTWLDPNFIGGYFVFVLCFVLCQIIYSKKISFLNLLTTSILSISIFLTYSRSALVALAIGVLIIGLVKSKKLLLIIIAISLVAIATSERSQQRVGELITSVNSVIFGSTENPDPTARLRLKNWEQTLSLISENPFFGVGYNNLSYIKAQKGYVDSESNHSASGSDSSLLTITATTGLIGLFSFLYFLWQIIKNTFKKLKTNPQFHLGYLAALFSLLGHSFFVNSLLFPQIMIPLWIFTGLSYYTIEKFQ
jgi:O-antigen ligase